MTLRIVLKHVTGYSVGFGMFIAGIPFGLYLVSIRFDRYLPIDLIAEAPIRIAVCLLTGIIGIVFVAWSNLYLLFVGKGGPADGFGVHISPRSRHLVTSGPYRYTRNPMAFGALSFYLGLAIFFNSAICLGLVVAVSVGALIYLKTVEEKRLLKDFGDPYQQYRKTVSMLVPLPPRKKT
jgi:protein-S-isoprenylcysteine O-methyltransferase Ste14